VSIRAVLFAARFSCETLKIFFRVGEVNDCDALRRFYFIKNWRKFMTKSLLVDYRSKYMGHMSDACMSVVKACQV